MIQIFAARGLIALALAILFGAPSSAQTSLDQLIVACRACHDARGQPREKNMPQIEAQPQRFLENQLVLIREGIRDVPQMKASVETLADKDISMLAAYFANQSVTEAAGVRQAVLFERGRSLSDQWRCGICHMPNFIGREQIPRLAGQREDYLLHTMRNMQANKAIGRDPIMSSSIYGIPDQDLRAIAHYLAHLKP
jgi:cytochrome c553